MAAPLAAFPPDHGSVTPPDPQAIRACLTPDVAAVFDTEWEIVLDEAKHTMDLTPVHEPLHKWRHFAYAEVKNPGTYVRMLATAARTLATGKAPEGQHLRRGDEGPDPPAVKPIGVPPRHLPKAQEQVAALLPDKALAELAAVRTPGARLGRACMG